MKYERRIYLGFIIIVLSFLPIVIGAFLSVKEVANEESAIISINARSMILAERLRYISSAQSAIMPVFVWTGNKSLIEIFEKQNEEFKKVSSILQDIETNQSSRELILNIQKTSDEMHALAAPGIKMREAGASANEVHQYFNQAAGPGFQKLDSFLDALVQKESDSLKSAKARAANSVRWVTNALGFLSLVALILGGIVIRLITKVMIQKKTYDETQRILMEQERKLSLARKETVEVVSHDLKNPLATIKMSIEMLLDQETQLDSESSLKDGLQIAYRSAESMEHLIKDLLDHAKIESGHLLLESKTLNLSHLVLDLAKRFEPLAKRKDILLKQSIRENIFAECDGGRVEQVISNLVGNALKFTPSQGQIEITAEIVNQDILISVQDSGSGIGESELPHIFDRFWQVRKSASQGTGLGLAISKAIIEAHHGQIWAMSEPGKGSKFIFSLPQTI